MPYINNLQYYTNGGIAPTDKNWGSYQYVSLADIVNNYMLINVGDDKLVNNVKRYEVLFHAKRGLQELNYDALKNIKKIELDLGNSLKMVLPPDYVNYIRISINVEGVLYPLHENRQAMSATAYLQDNNYNILFDSSGEIITGTSMLEIKQGQMQQYFGPGAYNGCMGWCWGGDWYFEYQIGARYGLDPESANINPTFEINPDSGVINFSSGARNRVIVLEYISDGMQNGNDDKVTVNKLFEDYIYAYITWAILNNKYGIQEYIINRVRNEKKKKLNNAKIRVSDIHPSRLVMVLRGKGKIIK